MVETFSSSINKTYLKVCLSSVICVGSQNSKTSITSLASWLDLYMGSSLSAQSSSRLFVNMDNICDMM